MASGNDMQAQMKDHRGTYGGFVSLLKWSVPITFVVVMLIIMLIAE